MTPLRTSRKPSAPRFTWNSDKVRFEFRVNDKAWIASMPAVEMNCSKDDPRKGLHRATLISEGMEVVDRVPTI